MNTNFFKTQRLFLISATAAVVLFLCSSIRHFLFQSTAYDLGWYDQVVYLIGRGKPPVVSFWGHHILGDHAAVVLYPLAQLYKIHPTVYWLFGVQAIALSSGFWLTWKVARQAGLNLKLSGAMAAVYLLYPVVFNLNLFDFHPEVLCIPGLLGGVWAARGKKMGWFCACILLTLSSKAVLSLTVAAMGVWLLVFEKRRWYGAIALSGGIIWFAIATQILIPTFSGGEAAGVGRYAFLGDSVAEIILNLFLKPGLVLSKIFTLPNLEYLALLFAPVIWAMPLRETFRGFYALLRRKMAWRDNLHHLAPLTPLVAILPTLAMNLITDLPAQKDLVHQYSLPALPFLLLSAIATLAAGGGWFRRRRWIIAWAIASFVILAKFGFFWSNYLQEIDTWQASQQAVSQVKSPGGVLTTAKIAPHLTHRSWIRLAIDPAIATELNQFDYILLNLRYPGWQSSPEILQGIVRQVQATQEFQLRYQQDEVVLFERVVR